MPWASVAGSVGSSLIGGLFGGDDNSSQIKQAAEANARAQQTAKAEAQAYLSPYLNTGSAANQKLAQALGIADPTGYAARPTRQQFENQAASEHMQQFGQGYNGWSDMGKVNNQIDQRYNQALQDWQTGKDAYLQQNPNSGGDGNLLKNFTNADFVQDPGYQFRLDEGMKGINRAAASRGGYDSGATLKALADYNQNFASNEFGNAYNRDSANKTREYNFLSGTSNQGQSAATGLAGVGQSTANNVGTMNANSANQVANLQNQSNENINDALQSGISNALYAYQKNKNTGTTSNTGYDGAYGYSKSSATPWYLQ